MSSILESLSKVAELLDYPKANRPSLHQRYGAMIRNVQHLYNKLSNSSESWAIGEKIITLQPGSDSTTISQEDSVGKILLITTHSTDPFAVERQIDFYDVQNMPFEWDFPQNYSPNWFSYYSGGYHNAERMAIYYNTDGTLKLQVKPIPSQSAQYKVKYSLGNWADKIDLRSSPVLSQFHDLFEIRTALDLLDISEWDGITEPEAVLSKRKGRENSLARQEARFLPDFESHIKEMTQGKMITRLGWND